MSEYTEERDRKCPRCGKPLPLEISVRAWHLEECGNYSTRKDKLARIDETARALYVAYMVQDQNGMENCAVWAYHEALALERARDEAVKEIK